MPTTPGVFDLVGKCHPSTIRFIIRRPDANFNLNQRNNFGQTPMMFAAAARKGKVAEKIIEYLIDSGADYERKDAFGRDILFYSVMFGLDDTTVGLIMSGDFDLLHQDIEDRTILFHAVSSNRVEIVRLLCSLIGCKSRGLQNLLHLQDRYGCNVFQLAACLGHEECLKLLLSQNQKLRSGSFMGSNQFSENTLCEPPQIFRNNQSNQTALLPRPKDPTTRVNISEEVISGHETPAATHFDSFVRGQRGQSIRRSMELLLNLQAYRNLPTFRTDSKILSGLSAAAPAQARSSPHQMSPGMRMNEEDLDAYQITELRFKAAERKKRQQTARSSNRSAGALSRKTSSLQQLPLLSRSDSIVQ